MNNNYMNENWKKTISKKLMLFTLLLAQLYPSDKKPSVNLLSCLNSTVFEAHILPRCGAPVRIDK